CGPLMPASKIGHPAKGKIVLKVNGQARQDGNLSRMIWNVPETISKLSEMVGLEAGDVIMTGTPSGVAATVAGDQIECTVEGVGKVTVTIGPPLEEVQAPDKPFLSGRRAKAPRRHQTA